MPTRIAATFRNEKKEKSLKADHAESLIEIRTGKNAHSLIIVLQLSSVTPEMKPWAIIDQQHFSPPAVTININFYRRRAFSAAFNSKSFWMTWTTISSSASLKFFRSTLAKGIVIVGVLCRQWPEKRRNVKDDAWQMTVFKAQLIAGCCWNRVNRFNDDVWCRTAWDRRTIKRCVCVSESEWMCMCV